MRTASIHASSQTPLGTPSPVASGAARFLAGLIGRTVANTGAVAASCLLALLALVPVSASAQQYGETECWNARARHFEGVRPGETQNDLDFSRCRQTGDYRLRQLDIPHECWNPRAGHYEGVRPGQRQDDLDRTRCRVAGNYRGNAPFYVEGPRECWNPRARHYENVRPGERQDDLDFNNCRRIDQQRRRYDEGWECWNPRARHYEGVRPNERQDDLDFSRCRPK